MEEAFDCIMFETEDGEEVSMYVIERTTIAGADYLLVTDSGAEEAQAYIMRKLKDEENQEVYEIVEDDSELEALSKVFAELLEDVEIKL